MSEEPVGTAQAPVTEEEREELKQAIAAKFIDGLIKVDLGCDAMYIGNDPELCAELANEAADALLSLGYRKSKPAAELRTLGTIEVCDTCYRNQGEGTMDDWRNCPQPKCPVRKSKPAEGGES